MNRAEFFAVLRKALERLPREEMENALVYYTEYFDDAGAENEQRAARELGDPSAIAAQIMADYAEKNPLPPQVKKPLSGWWILLAVFAAPIALPIAIALLAVGISLAAAAFVVVVSLGAVLFAFWLVAFIFCIVGVALFFAGFTLIVITPLGAFFVFGTGLTLAGAGLLCGVGMLLLSAASWRGLTGLINWIFHRKKGGAKHE